MHVEAWTVDRREALCTVIGNEVQVLACECKDAKDCQACNELIQLWRHGLHFSCSDRRRDVRVDLKKLGSGSDVIHTSPISCMSIGAMLHDSGIRTGQIVFSCTGVRHTFMSLVLDPASNSCESASRINRIFYPLSLECGQLSSKD